MLPKKSNSIRMLGDRVRGFTLSNADAQINASKLSKHPNMHRFARRTCLQIHKRMRAANLLEPKVNSETGCLITRCVSCELIATEWL